MVNKEAPLHLSKVQPVVDGQRTRVRVTTKPDGSKVRVAARSGKELGTVSPAKKK
jgi:large subunit ribosomal protein L24